MTASPTDTVPRGYKIPQDLANMLEQYKLIRGRSHSEVVTRLLKILDYALSHMPESERKEFLDALEKSDFESIFKKTP